MRILGACIFLSFLAGRLRHFKRMLLYLCFTLLFDLEDHHTKVFVLDSDFCYPAI